MSSFEKTRLPTKHAQTHRQTRCGGVHRNVRYHHNTCANGCSSLFTLSLSLSLSSLSLYLSLSLSTDSYFTFDSTMATQHFVDSKNLTRLQSEVSNRTYKFTRPLTIVNCATQDKCIVSALFQRRADTELWLLLFRSSMAKGSRIHVRPAYPPVGRPMSW